MKLQVAILLSALVCAAQTSDNLFTVLPNSTNSAVGQLRFRDLTAHYTGLQAPASVSTNIVWTTPAVDGTSGTCWGWTSAATLGWVGCAGSTAVTNGFIVTGESNVGPPVTTTGLQEYYDPSGHQAYILSYGTGGATAPVNLTASAFNFTGPATFGNGITINGGSTSAISNSSNLFVQSSSTVEFRSGTSLIIDAGASCIGCASGTYLPLAGGTMTGSILVNGSLNLGSTTAFWNNIYVNTQTTQIVNFITGSYPAGLRFGFGINTGLGPSGQLVITDVISNPIIGFAGGPGAVTTVYGQLNPSFNNGGTIGNSGTYWASAFINNLTVNSCTGCSGGGSFLPLSGGTRPSGPFMTGNILVNGTATIGDTSGFWNQIFVNSQFTQATFYVTGSYPVGVHYTMGISGANLVVADTLSNPIATFQGGAGQVLVANGNFQFNGNILTGGFTTVINSLGQFVGNGVITSSGVEASGFNIFGGGFGQSANVQGSFIIGGTPYTTLVFQGGVLVSYH